MAGRIKRMQRLSRAEDKTVQALPVCPLCQRVIPASQQDAHHFVPKSKGGRETRLLHRICHRQIHVLFTEAELARHLNTPEALLAQPQVQTFVAWVRSKPADFYEKSRKSSTLFMNGQFFVSPAKLADSNPKPRAKVKGAS